MKVIILAGGRGTRIGEETGTRPKPMVEIGGRPILHHIMKAYSYFGFNEFIICLGYKGHVIKEYFAHYALHLSNVTFNLRQNEMQVHHSFSEPWQVTLVDTGLETMTAGRIKRVAEFLGDERFMMTYGDGLANVDLSALLRFHQFHGRLATVTATRPTGRFGTLEIDDSGKVEAFAEKHLEKGWINGGFFVLEPQVLDHISGDEASFEHDVLPKLAEESQLAAFLHQGFWQPMDTLRDRIYLESLWEKGEAPWKVW